MHRGQQLAMMISRVPPPASSHLHPGLRLAGPARPLIGVEERGVAGAAARGRRAAPHQASARPGLGRPSRPNRADPAPAQKAAGAPASHARHRAPVAPPGQKEVDLPEPDGPAAGHGGLPLRAHRGGPRQHRHHGSEDPAAQSSRERSRRMFFLTARTEITDRILIFGERHLRSVLAEYARHYNGRRPHRSRGLRPPRPDHPAADLSQQRIKRRAILGGLLSEYERPHERPGQDQWPSSGTPQALDHHGAVRGLRRHHQRARATGRSLHRGGRRRRGRDQTPPRRILVAATLSAPAFSLLLFALADPLPLVVAAAEPDSLNQVVSSFGLGPAQFTSYHPSPLTGAAWDWWAWVRPRSEEHTSELQSHVNLVCRLLLEKK